MAKRSTVRSRKKSTVQQTTRPGRSAKAQRSNQGIMGEVRIIGGDFRGRKLPVLVAEGLRPTSDRVRETLFNWLQFQVPGAHCLDLFAGSGALGFEALSRGAKSVTFCELSPPVAMQLSANLTALKSHNGKVVQGDSLQWLDSAKALSIPYFDVVFLDPPFNQNLMQQAVDKVFISGIISPSHSWLYLEQEKSLDWPNMPDGWICHREKSTSQVKFGLFCYSAG